MTGLHKKDIPQKRGHMGDILFFEGAQDNYFGKQSSKRLGWELNV